MVVGKFSGWPASTRLQVQKTEWSWNTGQGQGQLPWLWNPWPRLHLPLWQNGDWGRFVREDVPEPRSNTLSRFQGTTTTKTESDEEISKYLCHLDKTNSYCFASFTCERDAMELLCVQGQTLVDLLMVLLACSNPAIFCQTKGWDYKAHDM